MEEIAYNQISQIDTTHWWFCHRRDILQSLLKKHFKDNTHEVSALDIGCGAGGNFEFLAQYCEKVVGIDFSKTAVQICKERYPNHESIEGDAAHLDEYFPPSSFDVVTVLSVIYHAAIKNDLEVLKQIHRVLKPNGLLLISEPAFNCLSREHDRVGHGIRRYTRKSLTSLIQKSGLNCVYAGYFNFASVLPAWLLARKDTILKKNTHEHSRKQITELQMPPKWINKSIYKLFGLERIWLKCLGSLPLGVSIIISATKPPNSTN